MGTEPWKQLLLTLPIFLLHGIGFVVCKGELDYIAVFLPQIGGQTANGTNILAISAQSQTVATIDIPFLNRMERFSIDAGETKRFYLRSDIRTSLHEFVSSKSIYIRTSSRVTVTGYNVAESSADSFMVLPIGSDFTRFRTISYTETYVNPKCVVTIASLTGRNVIEITSTKMSSFRYRQRFYRNGETLRVSLQRLQVLQVQSFDVTGLLVTSYFPVAVYSGCMCVSVPKHTDNCDHVVEQIPPISMWGTEYISAPVASRQSGEVFRIVPSCNNTRVQVNGAPYSSVDAGNYLEYTSVTSESLWITCNSPCLVALFLRGDIVDNRRGNPAMAILPHIDQYVSSATVSVHNLQKGDLRVRHNFNSVVHYIMLITKSENTVGMLLNGKVLGAGRLWTTVPGTDYSVTTFRAALGNHKLKHINRKSTFGVVSYGLGVQLAYAHLVSVNPSVRSHRGCQPSDRILAPANILGGEQPVQEVQVQTNYTALIPLVCLCVVLLVAIGFLVFIVIRLRDQLRRSHDQQKVIIVPRPSLPANRHNNSLPRTETRTVEHPVSAQQAGNANPVHYLELIGDDS